MSAQEVQILRDAYSQRTMEAFAAALHPEVEMQQAPEILDAGETFRGPEGVVEGVGRWLEEWETFRFEPTEIRELDACILMRIRTVGRAKASGVELEQDFFHLWTFRDGQPFRCEIFMTEQRALTAAAGQSGGP
jgi:ketosteroid isomerase-like protein